MSVAVGIKKIREQIVEKDYGSNQNDDEIMRPAL